MHRFKQVEEEEEEHRRESVGNMYMLGILYCPSSPPTRQILPIWIFPCSNQNRATHRTTKDINQKIQILYKGGLKKLQNYYFPPRLTHRLSQPNRSITSMQMQPATQVHVPFQNPTQHTPSKVYRSLVPPCVLQPKLQKKGERKKKQIATTQENGNKQVDPPNTLICVPWGVTI